MNKQEFIIAKNVIKKYESASGSIVTKAWFKVLLWLLVCLVIFILQQLMQSETIGDIMVIIISCFLGAAVCFSFTIESGEKTWNVIKPYINIKELKDKTNDRNT